MDEQERHESDVLLDEERTDEAEQRQLERQIEESERLERKEKKQNFTSVLALALSVGAILCMIPLWLFMPTKSYVREAVAPKAGTTYVVEEVERLDGRIDLRALQVNLDAIKNHTDSLIVAVSELNGKVESVKSTADEAKTIATKVSREINGKTGLKWRMENNEKQRTNDYNKLSQSISGLSAAVAKQDSVNAAQDRALDGFFQRLNLSDEQVAALREGLARKKK